MQLLQQMLRQNGKDNILLSYPLKHGRIARFARQNQIRHVSMSCDPHSLLDHVGQVHEVGEGEIGTLASLRGLEVVRHAVPGLDGSAQADPIQLDGNMVAHALLTQCIMLIHSIKNQLISGML